jgi:hypothetical protein
MTEPSNVRLIEVVALRKFKQYVHERLDAMHVPADPEPEKTLEHGCRVGERLNWLAQQIAEQTRMISQVPRTVTLLPAWWQSLWESCVTLAEKAAFKRCFQHLEALETHLNEAVELLRHAKPKHCGDAWEKKREQLFTNLKAVPTEWPADVPEPVKR